MPTLEFWADSYHEGNWACENLGRFLPISSTTYQDGFLPTFIYTLPSGRELSATVYGAYTSWNPLPQEVSDLLQWGKPDLIIRSPDTGQIVVAVEETAAVPTGNQALQRFERIFGSAKEGVPFWYLVAEYGLHIDQNVRRDSIWPTVGCIKLSAIYETPSVALHYSARDAPEDYSEGVGVDSLFETLARFLLFHLDEGVDRDQLVPLLSAQYAHMLDFIVDQWQDNTDYFPNIDLLSAPSLPDALAKRAIGIESALPEGLLVWRKTEFLPEKFAADQERSELIKPDPLLPGIEALVEEEKGYVLSSRTGSRPQPQDRVETWIREQEALYSTEGLEAPAEFNLAIDDFPKSPSGLRHLTTGKSIRYFIDSWGEFHDKVVDAYPRLRGIHELFPPDDAVLLYVSNSMKPGRIFGDPYTGQITAFSILFARDIVGQPSRIVVAYYPHQVHNQLADTHGHLSTNKGTTLLREHADLLIFHGGVAATISGDTPIFY